MQTIDLTQYLKVGLASDERMPISAPHLSLCEGFKPTEYGMSKLTSPTQFIPEAQLTNNNISRSYPFPQFFRGYYYSLLCDSAAIYSVNHVTGALTKLDIYNFDNQEVLAPITTGNSAWLFAEFNSGWFITNRVHLIFHLPAYSSKVFMIPSVEMAALANFRNRFMWGGVRAGYHSSTWLAFFQTLFAKGTAYGITQGQPVDYSVGWGSLSGGDLLMDFSKTIASTGNPLINNDTYTEADPIILDMLRRNQAGSIIMDGKGENAGAGTGFSGVRALYPMRKGVLVAMLGGFSYLYPVAGADYPFFGLVQQLIPVGQKNAGAVGGTFDKKLILDGTSNLWLFEEEGLKATRLGYRNQLFPYTLEVCNINYDPSFDEFYISYDSAGFILTKNGLAQIDNSVSGLFTKHEGLYGLLFPQSSITQSKMITAPIDFGSRETKTISEVECAWVGTNPVYIKLYYRDGYNTTWFGTESVQFDLRGRARIAASGVEFKIELSTPLGGNTISSLKVLVDSTATLAIGA